jgi:Co/Zn/Cd efflux system component
MGTAGRAMSPAIPAGAESPNAHPARYRAVARVLTRVLLLNLAVAVAKIVLGYTSGAVSILSDGFHSLTDSTSNVVALVGIRIAQRPRRTTRRAPEIRDDGRAASSCFS